MQVSAGEGPVEGLGALSELGLEAQHALFELLGQAKRDGVSAFRATIENQISISLNHEAWIGRWTTMSLGQVPWRRSMARWPRRIVPLSATKTTGRAEA
jgi:hypothetical protein